MSIHKHALFTLLHATAQDTQGLVSHTTRFTPPTFALHFPPFMCNVLVFFDSEFPSSNVGYCSFQKKCSQKERSFHLDFALRAARKSCASTVGSIDFRPSTQISKAIWVCMIRFKDRVGVTRENERRA